MKNMFNFSGKLVSCLLILIAFVIPFKSFSQADLTFTINELLNWQPSVTNQNNISYTDLHLRTHTKNFQIINGLDSNAKILYCPDGMDNFGPYIDSANQFNLFNFSHWQYIDILAWFGGSASSPIIIPSKAWIDAAHKNGVKIIGTVFMAPAVFGGSQAAVQSFLQQDSIGNFIAAAKLIEIANYYNFDGWILNFETSVNNATGTLATSFVNKFDSAYSGEFIWYDAMLANGTISYQNRLNANNAYFFQHSTGLFTNYNWTLASTVTSSNTYATGLGKSPFDVYTGADMWPTRPAQPAFTNYTWIDRIITNNVAKTSIAMFAMNFTFNYGPFSNFNNDSSDYNNFYSAERKIFSGIDEDPFTVDAQWKGLVNYIPVRTTITSLPFQTDFNTGHGFNYYENGSIFRPGSWHNMSHQSILPSWTFYKNGLNTSYDFNDAYNGGSSLLITSSAADTDTMPLFSTGFTTSSNVLSTEIAIKSASVSSIDSIALELKMKNNMPSRTTVLHPVLNGNWEVLTGNISNTGLTDTIIAVNLIIFSSGGYNLNVGMLKVDSNAINSVSSIDKQSSAFSIFQDTSDGLIEIRNVSNLDGQINIFDLKGSRIISETINKFSIRQITLPGNSVYIYEIVAGKEVKQGKIFVH